MKKQSPTIVRRTAITRHYSNGTVTHFGLGSFRGGKVLGGNDAAIREIEERDAQYRYLMRNRDAQ